MPNNYFQFKKFTIVQDGCAMKVGTDGCLLGAWFGTDGCKRILDVGTGSGLIALMTAQRSNALVTGVEIEETAAAQAAENVKNSPWSDRVEIICCDYTKFTPSERFDAIVSNPPYFANSLKCSDSNRTLARHNDSLSPALFFKKTKEILADNGKVSLVLPTDELPLWAENATIYGFSLHRVLHVHTTPRKPAKRVLAEFGRQACNTPVREDLILENSPGEYSAETTALLRDFYLKMA